MLHAVKNSEMADVKLVLFSLCIYWQWRQIMKYSLHPMLCVWTANSMAEAFSVCLPHMLLTPTIIYLYIYTVHIKMKTRLDRITYNLRQSVKSLTSWHWLLVKAEASQECGMPPQQMGSLSWAGAPSRERMLDTFWVSRWRENQSWNEGLSHLVAEKTVS